MAPDWVQERTVEATVLIPLETFVRSARDWVRGMRRGVSGALVDGLYRGNLDRGIDELFERQIVSDLIDSDVGHEHGMAC